jgi:hypothetical protein
MWTTLVLFALLVGVAGGGGAAWWLRSSTRAAGTPSAPPTFTPAGTDARSRLLPGAASALTGPVTADLFAGQFGEPSVVLHAMRVQGFDDGAVRTWSDGDRELTVEVLQFDSPDGARVFGMFVHNMFLGSDVQYDDRPPAAGVDGSGLFIGKAHYGGTKMYTSAADATRGRFVTLVGINDTRTVDEAALADLLRQQYALLPDA